MRKGHLFLIHIGAPSSPGCSVCGHLPFPCLGSSRQHRISLCFVIHSQSLASVTSQLSDFSPLFLGILLCWSTVFPKLLPWPPVLFTLYVSSSASYVPMASTALQRLLTLESLPLPPRPPTPPGFCSVLEPCYPASYPRGISPRVIHRLHKLKTSHPALHSAPHENHCCPVVLSRCLVTGAGRMGGTLESYFLLTPSPRHH